MVPQGSILVVDEETTERDALVALLGSRGQEIVIAHDLPGAIAAGPRVDLAVVALRPTHAWTLPLIEALARSPVPPAIVLVVGGAPIELVIEAFRLGAFEYVTSTNQDGLLAALDRCAARAAPPDLGLVGARRLVGTSPVMRRLADEIDRAAASRSTVLVVGESGTGKELVAAEIHARSARAAGPLVKVHCAALAESMLESELFGHERGAFTGAIARHPGRFELAHGGTLFLDEIGEISPTLQVKLLRVLQDHAFERVGGNDTIRVDVRVIAATNRDLAQMMAEGRFREDLFYRLDVVTIATPPLRAHPEDIPALARRLVEQHARSAGRHVLGLSAEALVALARYPWPGNVRELDHAIEHAVVLTPPGARVEVAALPPEVIGVQAPSNRPARPAVPGATLADLERFAILATLEACGGSTSRTAHLLGVSARKIQYRLQQYCHAPRSGSPVIAHGRRR